MLDPHDDTDVPSGTTDGAQMERTLPPVLRREQGGIGRERSEPEMLLPAPVSINGHPNWYIRSTDIRIQRIFDQRTFEFNGP